nr:helitron helicase-like domain-containing protein [Tanacetum cinerariifolium]
MAHFGGEHESGLKKEIVEGLIELLDNHNASVQLFRTARNKYMEAKIPKFKSTGRYHHHQSSSPPQSVPTINTTKHRLYHQLYIDGNNFLRACDMLPEPI